jgi:hypothetical protein
MNTQKVKKIPQTVCEFMEGRVFLDNFSPLFWAHHYSSTFILKEEK